MKFLLDANMPRSAAAVFAKTDTVVHVGEVGLGDASDADILAYALREQTIIITRDLDFANIVLHPIISHAGVVVLRVLPSFTAGQIVDFLKWFLAIVDKNQLPNSLVIVEPSRYRIRKRDL